MRGGGVIALLLGRWRRAWVPAAPPLRWELVSGARGTARDVRRSRAAWWVAGCWSQTRGQLGEEAWGPRFPPGGQVRVRPLALASEVGPPCPPAWPQDETPGPGEASLGLAGSQSAQPPPPGPILPPSARRLQPWPLNAGRNQAVPVQCLLILCLPERRPENSPVSVLSECFF